MNDLEQTVARAIDPVAWERRARDSVNLAHVKTLRKLSLVKAKAALKALPLTTEQLEGLASDDMVVVPRVSGNVDYSAVNTTIKYGVLANAAQEEQP